jgi:exodeoxyribonuclease VII large subunit
MVIASAEELRSQLEALSHRLRKTLENQLVSHDRHLESLRRALHDPRTMLGHLAQRMDDLTGRLELSLRVALSRRRDRFDRLQDSLQHSDPKVTIGAVRQRIAFLTVCAERSLTERLENYRQEFGDNAARLEVLSPLKTLARGYAVATRGNSGAVVTDAGSLSVGEQLQLRLFRGHAKCRVEALETGNT